MQKWKRRVQQQLLMEIYKEVKNIISKKGNTAVIKRKKARQKIADRLNTYGLKKKIYLVTPRFNCFNMLVLCVGFIAVSVFMR